MSDFIKAKELTPKGFEYFLIDGYNSGRIQCSSMGWTCVAYRIPQVLLPKCKDMPDLKKAGIYILIGTSDTSKDANLDSVYIGQSDIRKNKTGLYQRLIEHTNSDNLKKRVDADISNYEWSEALVFCSHSNSLGATEISYLENKLYNLAKSVNRVEVANGNEPHTSQSTSCKECQIDEFLNCIITYTSILGATNIFESTDEEGSKELTQDVNTDSINNTETPAENPTLYFPFENGKVAKAKYSGTKFIILKGSDISLKEETKDCGAKKLREKLRENLKDNLDSNGKLVKDVQTGSMTQGGDFVTGGHAAYSGKWHVGMADGPTYKSYIET